MPTLDAVYDDLQRLRAQCPLVLNITNFVVMNSTANALLAVGASPIMAHDPQEVGELAGIVGSLVLNIGTLRGPWIDSMFTAGAAAADCGKPVVFDPVGAGATTLRTQTSRRIMEELHPAIVRGNGSELLAVAGAVGAMEPERLARVTAEAGGGTRGVDSTHAGAGLEDVVAAVAMHCGCVAVASGAVDVISDGVRTARIIGGHTLMPKVTGMGCTATALLGAFAPVCDDAYAAAVSGMAVMSAAGAVAGAKAKGPGTLQLHFYDALYTLREADLAAHVEVLEA